MKSILLFGAKSEDRKACNLMMDSMIPCEYLGTGDENTPKLIYGYQEYRGIKKIKSFIHKG